MPEASPAGSGDLWKNPFCPAPFGTLQAAEASFSTSNPSLRRIVAILFEVASPLWRGSDEAIFKLGISRAALHGLCTVALRSRDCVRCVVYDHLTQLARVSRNASLLYDIALTLSFLGRLAHLKHSAGAAGSRVGTAGGAEVGSGVLPGSPAHDELLPLAQLISYVPPSFTF